MAPITLYVSTHCDPVIKSKPARVAAWFERGPVSAARVAAWFERSPVSAARVAAWFGRVHLWGQRVPP